jgi:pilus assembly protein CpaD
MQLVANLPTLARRTVCLLIGLAATLVSACSSSTENWEEVRVAPEPTPKLVSYRHVVEFAPGSAALTAAARQDLEVFLGELAVRYGDSIEVTAAAQETSPGTADEALVRQRLRAVARVVQATGVPVYQRGQSTSRAEAPNTVAVGVRRYVVVLPNCPDWTDKPGRNSSNQTHSNWGCATAINFGTMVADPADLARGHDLVPADGERLSRSIQRYRADETKPLLGNNASEVSTPQESKDSSSGGDGG